MVSLHRNKNPNCHFRGRWCKTSNGTKVIRLSSENQGQEYSLQRQWTQAKVSRLHSPLERGYFLCWHGGPCCVFCPPGHTQNLHFHSLKWEELPEHPMSWETVKYYTASHWSSPPVSWAYVCIKTTQEKNPISGWLSVTFLKCRLTRRDCTALHEVVSRTALVLSRATACRQLLPLCHRLTLCLPSLSYKHLKPRDIIFSVL